MQGEQYILEVSELIKYAKNHIVMICFNIFILVGEAAFVIVERFFILICLYILFSVVEWHWWAFAHSAK